MKFGADDLAIFSVGMDYGWDVNKAVRKYDLFSDWLDWKLDADYKEYPYSELI